MIVWGVFFVEANGSMGENIVMEREGDTWVPQLFADSAYDRAVAKFNEVRDDRLSFHKVEVVGTFEADAHVGLRAVEPQYCADGCCDNVVDSVELRRLEVIGG